MTAKAKIALIGVGYWGKNLLRNLVDCSEAELVGIYDTDTELAKEKISQYPTLRLYSNLDDLVEDSNIDGVVIATPVSSHYDLAKAALEANKHVLIEKPLCLVYQDAKKLVEEANKRGLVLMCDHTFCYSGPVVTLKGIIDSGILGEILFINSVRTNLGLFQKDVNVLWDLAPHDLSIAKFILGDDYNPICLSTSAVCHPSSHHAADAHLSIDMSSGVIFNIHNSWLSPVKVRQMTIVGTEKMLVWDDLANNEKIKIYDKKVAISGPSVKYIDDGITAPFIDSSEPLQGVVKNFSNCIRGLEHPKSPGTIASQIVKILELSNESIKLGSRIEVPNDL